VCANKRDLVSTPPRTQTIASEWRNGIRALNGEDMKGTTGRFPDKKGVYHWDNPNPA